MSKVLTAAGKTTALDPAEADENMSSLSGINEAVAGATYTVTIDDQNRTLEFTGTGCTVTLPLMSTITAALHTDDFKVTFLNSGTNDVTINKNVSNTFNIGGTSVVLKQDEYVTLETDSTGLIWNAISTNHNVVNAINPPEFSVLLNRASAQRQLGFTNDGAENIYFYGEVVGTNYDVGMFDAKNGVTPWNYDESTQTFNVPTTFTYDGDPVCRIEQDTAVTLSGASHTFTTVPAWAKKITLTIFGASSSGGTTCELHLRIGPSTGPVTTGYRSCGHRVETSGASSSLGLQNTYHIIGGSASTFSSVVADATVILTKISGNSWNISSQVVAHDTGGTAYLSGSSHGVIALAGTLEQIQVIDGIGVNFDAGTANLTYEG